MRNKAINRLMRSRIKKQNGLVAVFLVVAIVLIIGFGALVVDVDDMVLNRSKMQTAVDGAALAVASAAADSMADDGSNRVAIADAAKLIFNQIQASDGNSSLQLFASDVSGSTSGNAVIYDGSDGLKLTIWYANDAEEFITGITPDYSDDIYVRVSVQSFDLPEYLIGLFNVDKKISASAVAGPSSSSECEVFPMAVCALNNNPEDDYKGYQEGESYILYESPGDHSDMGPGNYQLLDVGSPSDLPNALAGDNILCLDLNTYESEELEVTLLQVDSETGQKTGLTDGVNTRFNVYSDKKLTSEDYPPDIYVHKYQDDIDSAIETAIQDAVDIAVEDLPGNGESDDLATIIQNAIDTGDVTEGELNDVFSDSVNIPDDIMDQARTDALDPDGDGSENITTDKYSDYMDSIERCSLGTGNADDDCANSYDQLPSDSGVALATPGRRVVTIPILDCDIGNSGKGTFNVMQLGCFFLMSTIRENNASGSDEFYGEFTRDCNVTYETGGASGLKGSYKIVLYKDPHSTKS